VSTPLLAAAPPSSSHPSPIFWAPSLDPLTTSCSGAAGRGAGRFGRVGALQEDEGGSLFSLGDLASFWQIADWKHKFYPQVTAGLNNRQLDSDLLFRRGTNRQREYLEAEGSFGRFLDTLFD
jgi:hypothetical protein